MSHSNQLESPEGQKLLNAVRKVCNELPEVEETIDGFGHATFKVHRKSFLIAGMGQDGGAISIKSDLSNQAILIRRGPYYPTPYIGQHGWVSLAEPLQHEWADVKALIRDGWRLAAPRRLREALPEE